MTHFRYRRLTCILGSLAAGLALLTIAHPAARGGGEKDLTALTANIDQRIAAAWPSNTKPAARADDAEFFRRVHLDLTGRIPSIVEIRDFLDDPRLEKRRLWVERMLQSAGDDPSYRDAYCNHFATVWRTWWLGQSNQQGLSQQVALDTWLRNRLKSNVAYDRIVHDLLSLDVVQYNMGRGSFEGSPSAFYLANDLLPENLAASTARLFLGVKLECAQCHAHPFAKWTREQFWEFAAFFTDVPQPGRPNPANKLKPHEGIKISGTEKVVKARFLEGQAPTWKDEKTRTTLSDWMTASDNPFFARAAVNRLWGYFFGTGLVEQLDGPHDDVNPNHLALLDELAKAFVASKYDLKFLISAIVASQTYQRTSMVSGDGPLDRKLFARMSLRGLSPEQLFDSLAVATECVETAAGDPGEFLIGGSQTPRAQFAAKFPNQEDKTDYQMSILQALYLMNNDFIARHTSLRKNRTLATLAEQRTSNVSKVESLYLVVLSRKPRPEETTRFVAYIDAGDAKSALGDVFWILLNSPEFILNH